MVRRGRRRRQRHSYSIQQERSLAGCEDARVDVLAPSMSRLFPESPVLSPPPSHPSLRGRSQTTCFSSFGGGPPETGGRPSPMQRQPRRLAHARISPWFPKPSRGGFPTSRSGRSPGRFHAPGSIVSVKDVVQVILTSVLESRVTIKNLKQWVETVPNVRTPPEAPGLQSLVLP